MSLFAGVVALDARRGVPEAIGDALLRALSREPRDQPRVQRGPSHLLAQVLLPSETLACDFSDAAGNVTLLAGAPLFGAGPEGRGEVEQLHQALRRDEAAKLQEARGSYCAVHWDAHARRLSLVADKLGLRPIYFGIERGLLFFSTALRVLESLGVMTGRIDVQGVTEIASFGYPLAARSPYESIRTLEAGEIVRFSGEGVQSQRYWRWDRLPASSASPDRLPRTIYEAFLDAVRRRLDGERDVVAGLSGGLDSRCVVAGLQASGASVHTLNFAPGGSEDLVLGRLAAQALGTRHFEFTQGPLEFWDRMQAAHRAWLEQLPDAARPPHPYRLWSGDGGSCAMGHIYLNEDIIERMRAGDTPGAIDAYLQYNRIGLPGKLLVRRQRERLLAYLHSGVHAELDRLQDADVARRMHLFLMVNGQRRLLAKHYENIDLRRFELITPFFDAQLLKLVLTSPIEGFLRHRFYGRWLQEFAPEVRGIAWQVYPGHATCPVPKPGGLRSQWDNWYDEQSNAEMGRRELAIADELQSDPHFPAHLLNRHVLWLARRLTGLGLGDYGHVIQCAAVFTRYSRAGAG